VVGYAQSRATCGSGFFSAVVVCLLEFSFGLGEPVFV